MAHYCTFWDWKSEPPFDEIQARINSLLERGATGIYLVEANCGRDDYCLVISDQPLTDEEAEQRWDDWFGSLPDEEPYDWSFDDEAQAD